MFTENYIKYRYNMFYNSNYYAPVLIDGTAMTTFDKAYAYFGDIGAVLGTARVRSLSATSSGSTSQPSDGSKAYPGVYFGTGRTPANKADYCLESPITSGLSVGNPSSTVKASKGNGIYTVSATFTLTNTTEEEINIWEIGLFTGLAYYQITKYYTCPVLMERTVLTEPITIPAGETNVVTYTLTFKH